MAPVNVYPVGRQRHCGITSAGTISFPEVVIQRLGWQYGDEIGVAYLQTPLVLLFYRTDDLTDGFKLSYLNRGQRQKSGGKLSCQRLTNQVLRSRVALPLDHLAPIYLQGSPYELALMLLPPAWERVPFSRAGHDELPADTLGTYRIVNGSKGTLRIGEGVIAARMREHLNHTALVRSGKHLEWLALPKADAVILERVLLSRYTMQHGELPPFNKIHA